MTKAATTMLITILGSASAPDNDHSCCNANSRLWSFFSIMHLGAVNRSINTCVVVDVVRRGASSLTSDRPLDIAGRSLTGELRVLSAGNQVSTSIDRATVVEDTSSSVQNVVCNKPISTTVQMHTEQRNCKKPVRAVNDLD